MDCNKKIEKYLKIMCIEKKENTLNSSQANVSTVKISTSWKQKIKSIPVVGKVMWYFYSLLKAPLRILALTNEINSLRNELSSFSFSLKEIRKTTYLLKANLSHRLEKPEEYVILDASEFVDKKNLIKNQSFYNLFEDVFRGQDIEERLKKYVSFVERARENTLKKGFFLDFGFGRGEFLRILKNSGIIVKGVEINKDYVDALRKEGFDVWHGDGLEYLKNLPDNSLTGLSVIHVIEHLSFEYLKELLIQAYRKIIPGGILILETPNPKCSIALSNFYIDFTHLRPYPHELVCFLLEWVGFSNIKLILSTPADRAFRTGNPLGDYMDYTLIGFKE